MDGADIVCTSHRVMAEISMFGWYRYGLALLVVQEHLWGEIPWAGHYAVFGFFLLSGYLMTRVLDRTYGWTRGGVGRYLLNRATRVYPMYWVVTALSAGLVLVLPDPMNGAFRLPATTTEWISNVAIFGLDRTMPRLVPPAWSLHVELTFYVLLALVLARTSLAAALWCAMSIALTVFLLVDGAPWQDRYYTLMAASLPFSLGAVIWHFAAWMPTIRVPAMSAIVSAYALNLIGAGHWGDPMGGGLYIALALSAALVVGLSQRRGDRMPPVMATLDARLGELSFPIFLVHIPVGEALGWLFLQGEDFGRGFQLLMLSLVPVHLSAHALVVLVDRTIEPLRTRIRSSNLPLAETFPPVRERVVAARVVLRENEPG